MNYPEIFTTTVTEGVVTMKHLGSEILVSPWELDEDIISLSIDDQIFCKHDLLELSALLARLAESIQDFE